MKELKDMTIGIANDHAGTELKFYLMEQLKNKFKEIKKISEPTRLTVAIIPTSPIRWQMLWKKENVISVSPFVVLAMESA